MLKSFLFTLVIFIVFSGCNKQDSVDKNKLADVYISVLFAEDSLSFAPDSLMKVKNNIFQKNEISEKEYLSILDSFKDDKTEWASFFDLVTAKLDSMLAIEDSLRKEADKKKINPKKFLSENQKSN